MDAPGSRYHLRDWDYGDAVKIQPYLDEGLLTSNQNSEDSPIALTKPNNSILLVANVARGKISANEKVGRNKPSHFRALSFVNALRKGTELHSLGPIRMLMWLPEAEKVALLPRTVALRRKTALQVESYFHVEEIAGNAVKHPKFREARLDLESGMVVAGRMKKAGIDVPEHRQDDLQKEIQKNLSSPGSNEPKGSIRFMRDWKKEAQHLEKEFAEGKFSQFEGGPVGPHEVRKEVHSYNLQTFTQKFFRLRGLRGHLKENQKMLTTVEDLIQEEAEMDTLDSELQQPNLDPEACSAKSLERDRIASSLQAKLENVNRSVARKFAFIGDERRSFALDPPLLMWDRRTAEPLKVEDEEFFPSNRLALLDFQPRVPVQYPLTSTQTIYYDYICLILLHNGNQSIKDLAHAAPGAFEALTPRVPALRDPRKGGRRNLEDLRTRVLTTEMVYELALAWEKWPFKPPISDLIKDAYVG